MRTFSLFDNLFASYFDFFKSMLDLTRWASMESGHWLPKTSIEKMIRNREMGKRKTQPGHRASSTSYKLSSFTKPEKANIVNRFLWFFHFYPKWSLMVNWSIFKGKKCDKNEEGCISEYYIKGAGVWTRLDVKHCEL